MNLDDYGELTMRHLESIAEMLPAPWLEKILRSHDLRLRKAAAQFLERAEAAEQKCDEISDSMNALSDRTCEWIDKLTAERDSLREQLAAANERAERVENEASQLRADADMRIHQLAGLHTKLAAVTERADNLQERINALPCRCWPVSAGLSRIIHEKNCPKSVSWQQETNAWN